MAHTEDITANKYYSIPSVNSIAIIGGVYNENVVSDDSAPTGIRRYATHPAAYTSPQTRSSGPIGDGGVLLRARLTRHLARPYIVDGDAWPAAASRIKA